MDAEGDGIVVKRTAFSAGDGESSDVRRNSRLRENAREDAQGRTVRLPAAAPFRFAVNRDYLARSPNECLWRVRDGRVIRAIDAAGETVVVEVAAGGPGGVPEAGSGATDRENGGSGPGFPEAAPGRAADAEDVGVVVRFLEAADGAVPSPRARAAAADFVREWLDLDRDLTPFYETARRDPLLAPVVERFRGLRLVGIPDLFEALAWSVIGQQINMAYAYTLKRRFVERFGRRVTAGGETLWLFPGPERIASLEAADLQGMGLSARKGEYLIHIARLIAEGRLSKEKLREAGRTGGRDAAGKLLCAIRGIGPWTAHYALMFCLRFPDAFPIDDVGLHNAVKTAAGLDRKPTKAELRRLADGWAGWEAYATFYLWRLLY